MAPDAHEESLTGNIEVQQIENPETLPKEHFLETTYENIIPAF